MTSIYRRQNVFYIILNVKGRTSVEQNAIVHVKSARHYYIASPCTIVS